MYFLLIATNIPMLLMTGFVVQGHIYVFHFLKSYYCDLCNKTVFSFNLISLLSINVLK